MKNYQIRKIPNAVCIIVLFTALMMLPLKVSASNSDMKYVKKIKTSEPCYVVVTAKDKNYHKVDLQKGKTSLQGAFWTRPDNSYTVKWLVPKGTFKLYANTKISKLKIKKKSIPSMGTPKTIKWKLKAKPIPGYAESDINTVCYKFKAPDNGWLEFDSDDVANMALYNSKFKMISDTTTDPDVNRGFVLKKGKKYYLSFTNSSMSQKNKIKIKCSFNKVMNTGAASKNKAVEIFAGRSVEGLVFPEKDSSGWVKYTVTGNESLTRDFNVEIESSDHGNTVVDIYLNDKLVDTNLASGNPMPFFYETVKAGDVVYFRFYTRQYGHNIYNCCYYKITKK